MLRFCVVQPDIKMTLKASRTCLSRQYITVTPLLSLLSLLVHRLPPLTWPKFLSDVAYRFLTCVENAQGQETTATTSHSPWAGTCYKQKRQSFLFFPPDEFGFDTIREQKPRGRLRTSVGNQTLPRVYSSQARRHCSAINASDGREACRNTRLVFG